MDKKREEIHARFNTYILKTWEMTTTHHLTMYII